MKPVLVYDAACELCRRWVLRWRARTGDRVDYLPLQQRGVLRRLGIPRSEALRAAQLVTDGRRYRGADAVFRVLEHAPEVRTVARAGRLPGVRRIAELVYRAVASHRALAERIDRLLLGRQTVPPGARFVRRLFVSALGGVYLIAFTSLGRQVKGLYGEHGIRPIRDYLEALRQTVPARTRIARLPTLFWIDASDATLVRACRAGQAGALLLALGLAPRTTALGLWLLYLSFVSAGREFLSFQWDALLLENGLYTAIAAGPAGERPPWTAVALMRWLALRLHFESGHCKLASGDPTWRSGGACAVHFETQPLPTRLGWHAHQLPRWLERVTTYAVLGLELGAPWLAFAPRRWRRAGFVLLETLQALIAATGNYGFFNLLAAVDNLWLLDDAALGRTARGDRAARGRRVVTALAALPVAAVSVALVVERLWPRRRLPAVLERAQHALAPLRSINPYGLFAVMTTERPEIVIEGSDDGVTWREYGFRFKPGDVHAPPRLAAPHQPRLDWQMWFAALGPPPPWFLHLLERLLEPSRDVLALFEHCPFGERAPRYVRALLYDYRMTDRATRRRTGAWWHRELRGLYVPPLALRRAGVGPAS